MKNIKLVQDHSSTNDTTDFLTELAIVPLVRHECNITYKDSRKPKDYDVIEMFFCLNVRLGRAVCIGNVYIIITPM